MDQEIFWTRGVDGSDTRADEKIDAREGPSERFDYAHLNYPEARPTR